MHAHAPLVLPLGCIKWASLLCKLLKLDTKRAPGRKGYIRDSATCSHDVGDVQGTFLYSLFCNQGLRQLKRNLTHLSDLLPLL